MYRTPEQLKVLYDKFDRDVLYYSRGYRVLLAIDQFFNVLIFNGSMDETISSNIGRKIEAGTATKFEKLICKFLHKLESEHCKKSLGE